MCTMIVDNVEALGSAKGKDGWFPLTGISVSYDHPFHAPFEHALNIDFVARTDGNFQRVSAELTAESARELIASIERVLEEAHARNISLDTDVLKAS
jgi:hypothetical protein